MFINIDDAKIYATAFGPAGESVILGIGGWIGSWELWAEPFNMLSQRWRTIAYDHRGSGATMAPVASITFDRLVDDVFAVLDAWQVEQCVLAAESAGALTALGAALKYPDRIAGLVLVDGMAHRQTSPEKDPFLMGLRHAYPATLDRFVEMCVPEPDSAHIKRWGRQIIGRASQDAAVALYLTAGEADLRSSLSQITQPTLLLHGEADVIVPLEESRKLAKSLPNSRLVLLPGAGHVPTLTFPGKIAREIMDFFAPTSDH